MKKHLRNEDMFAMLVGALGHDLDHPGTNNSFQVQAMTDIAVTYNDQSVLEMHHAAVLFRILLDGAKDPDRDVLRGLSKADRDEFRRVSLLAILSTDMKHHGAHVSRAREFKLADADPKDVDPAERLALVELLVHSADIGAQVMPPTIAQDWSDRVIEEFGMQTRQEAELGLPVTAFMSGLEKPKAKGKAQGSFVDFVVAPLWRNLTSALFPDTPAAKAFLDNLAKNRDIFTAMASGEPYEQMYRKRGSVARSAFALTEEAESSQSVDGSAVAELEPGAAKAPENEEQEAVDAA